MDYDSLNKIGETIMACILHQDTTELIDIVSSTAELWTVDDGVAMPEEEGKKSPSRIKNVPTQGGLTPRGAKSGNPVASKTVTTPRGQKPLLSPRSQVAAAPETSTTPRRRVRASTLLDYHVYYGVDAIGNNTKDFYRWLVSGKVIAKPRFIIEVKRTGRKHAKLGKGRVQEKAEKMEDPRQLSSITILWGRLNFLLEDKCYINDEGHVQLIDRRHVVPEDDRDPHYLKEKAHFNGVGKGRINAVNNKPPVLDFSFKDMELPTEMMTSMPKAGKRHEMATIYQEKKAQEASEMSLHAAHSFDGKVDKSKVLIKAKGRSGNEEVYEFKVDGDNKALFGEEEEPDESDVLRNLIKELKSKFVADSVRICNNQLTSISRTDDIGGQ